MDRNWTYLCLDWISIAVLTAAWTTIEVTIAATLGTRPAMAAAILMTSKIGDACCRGYQLVRNPVSVLLSRSLHLATVRTLAWGMLTWLALNIALWKCMNES